MELNGTQVDHIFFFGIFRSTWSHALLSSNLQLTRTMAPETDWMKKHQPVTLPPNSVCFSTHTRWHNGELAVKKTGFGLTGLHLPVLHSWVDFKSVSASCFIVGFITSLSTAPVMSAWAHLTCKCPHPPSLCCNLDNLIRVWMTPFR